MHFCSFQILFILDISVDEIVFRRLIWCSGWYSPSAVVWSSPKEHHVPVNDHSHLEGSYSQLVSQCLRTFYGMAVVGEWGALCGSRSVVPRGASAAGPTLAQSLRKAARLSTRAQRSESCGFAAGSNTVTCSLPKFFLRKMRERRDLVVA